MALPDVITNTLIFDNKGRGGGEIRRGTVEQEVGEHKCVPQSGPKCQKTQCNSD